MAPVTSNDAGTGLDSGFRGQVLDVSTGVDFSALTAYVSSSDTGTGGDGPGNGSGFGQGAFGLSAFGSYDSYITVQSSDAGTGADAGTLVVSVSSADSGLGVDASLLDIDTVFSSDSGLGVDSSPTEADSVSSFDTGLGVDAGTLIASVPSSDTGTGADTAVIAVASSDAGSGLDTGVLVFLSADTGHGQEGDTESAVSADTALGVESGFVSPFPADYDRGFGWEYNDGVVFIAVNAVSDQDSGSGTEQWFTSGPLSDIDVGTGVDSFTPPAVTVFDTGSGAELAQYTIEVFPYPPAWLFAQPGGGYLLVWRPGTPEERTLHQFGSLSRGEMARVAEIIDRMRDADSLSLVSDIDAAAGSESNSPTATVVQYVTSTQVTCSVPS